MRPQCASWLRKAACREAGDLHGGPVLADLGADGEVFRPGTVHRTQTSGVLAGLRGRGIRRPHRGRQASRIVAKGGQSVQLDHYLEVLKTKPGALPGSTALARARESGAFTNAHEAFWAASRRVNGDADGTRELIDVLLLHRSLDAGDIKAGIIAALGVGAVSADVVAVEARRHASTIPASGSGPGSLPGAHEEVNVQRAVSLTQRRLVDLVAVIAGLPPDTRPLPSIGVYDELLAKRIEHPAGTVSKENIS